jgi:hypothetical protein
LISLKHRWTRFREKHNKFVRIVELSAHISTILTAVFAILGSGITGYLLSEHEEVRVILGKYGTTALVVMTFLGWTAALLLALRYNNVAHKLRRLQTSAREESSRSTQIVSGLRLKIDHLESEQQTLFTKFDNISIRFFRLARHNAQCDKVLFDIFCKSLLRRPTPEGPLISALNQTDRNIDEVLTSARTIFLRLTGKPCAICIKTVDPDLRYPIRSFYDFRVYTLLRDSYSRTLPRATNDKTRIDFVGENTADRYIFTPTGREYLNDVWANDDLIELHQRGEYVNGRDNWYSDYTATVVAGISNHDDERNVPWRGMLCIDNIGGGLDNSVSKYYARELAARVSIMVYRHDILRKLLEPHREASGDELYDRY